MDETSKYLIHASITADGIVERSDVVGAIFGQTEGLLGDDLDLRDLQQSSKVGRIDVEITSEGGQSFGHVTIASSLDRVETAILAASLETITRVGPCQAHVEVTDIEDVREAKRREVVDRAKELLANSFDEDVMDSTEILEEVRESVRVEDITEFADLPAGPRVTDSDAIIVVEGRSDVLTLLKYGVKNAIAVEGTNVPESVAELTQDRTVTAFLDGDRGGELILRELAQVGDVDYVAFAPEGQSVEDLERGEVMRALREKVAYDRMSEGARRAATGGDPAHPPSGSSETGDEPDPATREEKRDRPARVSAADGPAVAVGEPPASGAADATGPRERATETTRDGGRVTERAQPEATGGDGDGDLLETSVEADGEASVREPGDDDGYIETDAGTEAETGGDGTGTGPTFSAHVDGVVGERTGVARLLDGSLDVVAEVEAAAAFDALDERDGAGEAPYAVVVDGEVSQRLVDVAAQRGVEHLVGRSAGEFVKKPTSVRVRTADQF